MNDRLAAAEAKARKILAKWIATAEQATGPGDSWSLTSFDQQMIAEIAAAFEVEPWPAETVASTSGLAWTRAWLATALSFNPAVTPAMKTEAFARATRSAGEALIEVYRRRSPLQTPA
jgi:hypothetical protein